MTNRKMPAKRRSGLSPALESNITKCLRNLLAFIEADSKRHGDGFGVIPDGAPVLISAHIALATDRPPSFLRRCAWHSSPQLSEREIEQIIKQVPILGIRGTAKLLGRDDSCVSKYARRMGINSPFPARRRRKQ